ncbi:biotin--[acetyl-CoA-carboxylase] ligase [Campylobacter sp. JMF_06 NA1]|uniref:biotin--[acetyl-CoA-carboxylase] ligase n=1 Tax=Campylobacter sp. JMF_06 NA1 TaxID=2983823 RepID=UPI0022E9FBB4|nr:biotin--[acetyl-CoA-carboxylase] ligase [Campylobacter sp. JMF_06 NA1]MDA3077889.1 biotin--[acetyl-CoA-carboxylase] ligase [Campylobacter sp. JMF_06 NA1]
MQIEFAGILPSTQSELIERLKNGSATAPFCLVAQAQSSGLGSRGNSWESASGNLAFSFCVEISDLPQGVPLQSSSIYFAMIMREFLASCGSEIWLKWPNDFYINDRKIGGILTNKIKNTLVCGIGINLVSAPEFAGILDIEITPKDAVEGFLNLYKNKISWKQIFSKFSLQFRLSQNFCAHIEGEKVPLSQARLCDDGAIIINKKRIYSLR